MDTDGQRWIQMDGEQLSARIRHQKHLHETARTRKGQRPVRTFCRSELEALFRAGQEVDVGSSGMIQTVIGFSYPPCTLPLSALRPMHFNDLRLETRHEGRVLFVRAFGHAIRTQAIQNAVEDEKGGVERLAVYNYISKLEASQVLTKNHVYAIKEPYYKVTGDGSNTLRVDHPSDLVSLRRDDLIVPPPLRPRATGCPPPTAIELKEIGNAAYKAKNFLEALDHYSHALHIVGDQQPSLAAHLRRNRALVNLHLGRYEFALADADAAVVLQDLTEIDLAKTNGKAHYRRACASYHLTMYQRAKCDFEKVLHITPGDPDALRELHRTELRIAEALYAEYDFDAMKQSVTKLHKRLDHANYAAHVETCQTADRGRGLFATQDIAAGGLIMCEKACEVAFDEDEAGKTSVILDLNNDSVNAGTHATRLGKVIHKLLHSPGQAMRFMDLHDGGYEPKKDICVLENDVVALDTFRVQAILRSNGFGLDHEKKRSGGSTGVWIHASYANHSCIGNVSRAFIGDMMIVRASRDIRKGDEIMMRYGNPDKGIQDFQGRLLRCWGFNCACDLCQAEEKVQPAQQKRRIEIMNEVNHFLENNHLDDSHPPTPGAINKAENWCAALASTYDECLFKKLPRTSLQLLSQWLCMAYAMESPGKLLQMCLLTLRNLGIMVTISKPQKQKVVIDRTNARLDLLGVHAAMYAGAAFEHEGRNSVAKQMRDYGKELYQTMIGSLHGFDESFGHV